MQPQVHRPNGHRALPSTLQPGEARRGELKPSCRAGRAIGTGKTRTPSACPAAAGGCPPGPRLTSGSDQGHNVLASGQGLAAGRRGLEAGRSEGERRGGENRKERQTDRETESSRGRDFREVKKRNTEPERGKPKGGRERERPKARKGEIEVENERHGDTGKHQ